MFIRDLADCKEIIAGDDTILREILNPEHSDAVVDPAWRLEDEEILS